MELARTHRLILREICAHDSEDYFQIFGCEEVCRFDDFGTISRKQAKHDVLRIMDDYEDSADKAEYAVELPDVGRMIGVLCHSVESRGIFIGFHFNPEFGRKGYATEATKEYLDYLQTRFEKPIYALVDPENIPSISLLGRLGFRRLSERRIRVAGKSKREDRYGLALTPKSPLPQPPKIETADLPTLL